MAVPRFWREADQRYNLKGAKCGNCGSFLFPVKTMCPTCRHLSIGKLTSHTMTGEGVIETFTVVHAPAPGFELQAPYVMAVVRLAEGPRVTAQIVDLDPAQAKIGLQVRKVFRRISQDGESGVVHYGYKFAPVPGPEGAVPATVPAPAKPDPSARARDARRGGPAG